MRLGIAAAVPVEVVAALAPAAAVVLTEDDDEAIGAVLMGDVVVAAPHGQLPADLGLGLDEGDALTGCKVMEGAAVAPGEISIVVEDAGIAHDAGLARVVLLFDPALLAPGVDALPQARIELCDPSTDALLIGLLGEVGAECAATYLGPVGVDALSAVAEDADPARGEPGEVSANELVFFGRIDEFNPLTGEVERHFWHEVSLGATADIPRR